MNEGTAVHKLSNQPEMPSNRCYKILRRNCLKELSVILDKCLQTSLAR